jgi:hypothetical protein
VLVFSLRPEAGGEDAITVQEDELVDAEWQSLAQFEANPFPQTIPLLGQVWTMSAAVCIAHVCAIWRASDSL